MENNLASELLREVKSQSKRWFIAFIVCFSILCVTNVIWLYAWTLPAEDSVVTIESNDEGNANYIDGERDIINGKNNGCEESTQK